jgi:hypothetical protein
MVQTVIRTQPINLTGLWRLKVLLPKTKGLLDVMEEMRRTGKIEKDEQILDTLDELANETMDILKQKGISLTVEEFLKERERRVLYQEHQRKNGIEACNNVTADGKSANTLC